ncbi:hypothetical protein [Pseudomonas sp. CMR5c]|uniref:hypothetical protein n=1 Tax=Pseudomonas TaxID=286 RepID=UPI000A6B02EF|nr:hypothetical protein [Pseudomonas sp. CMR5c]AZC20281.1 hypothetical protein C4K40_4914 [Pseudomonas sp. CMR5c]
MTQTTDSSKDFVVVPDKLAVATSERFVHREVLASVSTEFSYTRHHAVGVVDLPVRPIGAAAPAQL